MMTNENTVEQFDEEIVYCSNHKCDEVTCARNIENSPRGVKVKMERFSPNKYGVCEDYLD